MLRQDSISLCSGWKFHLGDCRDAAKPDCDDSAWQDVCVPHDWSIAGPFREDVPSTGVKTGRHVPTPAPPRYTGFLPTGVAWYRKGLALGHVPAGKRLFLEFEGAFRNTAVWINGGLVGRWPWGYTGAIYDVSRHLRRDGSENQIAVRVDNSAGEGWWYEGGGIYRPVRLHVTGNPYMPDWGPFVYATKVSAHSACVNVRTDVKNDGPLDETCKVCVRLTDPRGRTVAETCETISPPPWSTVRLRQTVKVPDPELWSPDAPSLYGVEVSVRNAAEITDSVSLTFGIRWFEFTADSAFFLNGCRWPLRGANVHQDHGALGVALPSRAHEQTVEALKSLGANFLRVAHHDPPRALMDACDRLGMLVWAETRYLDQPSRSGPPLRAMIRRHRNHPSIIAWGLANTAGSPDGRRTQWLNASHEIVREEDPTRPTAFACEGNTDPFDNGFAFVTDLAAYNGGGGPGRWHERDHALYHDRRILLSEYSSGRGARGVYEERAYGKEDYMEPYDDGRVLRHAGHYASVYDLCRSHEEEYARVIAHEWLAGGAMWSGIEYRGESPGWPIVTSQFGIFDVCRFPKDVAWFYRQEWTREPMVHIFPHWTWPGREGESISVWAYTTCEEVELHLNGRPLGKQRRKPGGHLEWAVRYEPGALVAEGRQGGKSVCRCERRTAGPPVRLGPACGPCPPSGRR